MAKKKKDKKGFFITGTDTGVGKTYIAAALIRLLKGMGLRVGAMKPFESGCLGDTAPADGAFLKEMAEMEEPLNEVVPYTFKAPLAPITAAALEGTSIDMNKVKSGFERLGKKYDAVIVEGIGGLLVPISGDHCNCIGRDSGYYVLDLALELGLPLVVVARPSLGTINHTLLTLRCALEARAEVAGVVINHQCPASSEGIAERTSPSAIESLSPVPLIGEFPFVDLPSAQAIEDAARKSLDTSLLKKFL